jgi:hypothetical protein
MNATAVDICYPETMTKSKPVKKSAPAEPWWVTFNWAKLAWLKKSCGARDPSFGIAVD